MLQYSTCHAQGPITFTPDRVTGLQEFIIDETRYFFSDGLFFSVSRNDAGVLVFSPERVLCTDDNPEYTVEYLRTIGFVERPIASNGKPEEWGRIDVYSAIPVKEKLQYVYFVEFHDCNRISGYFVRNAHDLADLIAQLRFLGDVLEVI